MCCQHKDDDKTIELPCATMRDCQAYPTPRQEFVLRALLASGIATRTFPDPLTQTEIDNVIRQAEWCYSRVMQ